MRYEPVHVYTMNLDLAFRWTLYTTSFIRVTTLYGPSYKDWSLGDRATFVALVVALAVG
jgi:hypothetical protein